VLVVIDCAKALRKAVRHILGIDTPVQRCVRHKERNVLGHLPERDRPAVKRRPARGLEAHRPRRRAGPPRRARRRARAQPPRHRRVAARGPRGNAHPAAPRNRRTASPRRTRSSR
jgi:hypothetical protein